MSHLIKCLSASLLLLLLVSSVRAEGLLELETTVIKGNKELPQILYLVPWQETKSRSIREEQRLTLHSLFGDLFTPMSPEKLTDIHNELSQHRSGIATGR